MLNSTERIAFIIKYISAYKDQIELANSVGLYDSAKQFEVFSCELCSLWFGQRFLNLNVGTANYPYFDLLSDDGTIYIQVSTVKNVPVKIRSTLEKINNSKDKRFENVQRAVFFVLSNGSIESVVDYSGDNQIGNIPFRKSEHLITTKIIVERAQTDLAFQQDLYNLLAKDFKRIEDSIHLTDSSITLNGDLNEPAIQKICYSLAGNPIPRRFSRLNLENHAVIDCSETLYEICKKEKHVVLLDAAGYGKSVELKRVAADASNAKDNIYPLLFDLKFYSDEVIEIIINKFYPVINYNRLFLIFDAYDELLPDKRLEFARKINCFVQTHPETMILISSRSNFYRKADDKGSGSTLQAFKEYGLILLSKDDVDKYVISKGVSTGHFWNTINANSLNDMVCIPFYLNHICELLQRNTVISGKSQLMHQIVCSLFDHDLEKYVNTVQELNEKRERILWQLGKMAFAMQCMHQKCLSNTDYEVLMAAGPIDYASLIRYSGLFKKTTNETWEFEHNNFREYLAAKYLSGLELEDIKAVFCVDDGSIKESWINVLSYLVVLFEDDSLLNWIIEANPELVISFENDRIPPNERTRIIIALLNTWAERNVWLSRKYGHISRIAKFGQSETLIDYLLDRISNPKHFRERANALLILFFVTDKYGKEEKIRRVLFDFIQKDVGEEYGRYIAIETLGELQLHNPEITDYLVSHLTKNHGEYELGVVKYLAKHENPGKYLPVLFEQYLLARDKSKSGHEWNICASIEEIILALTSFELMRDAFLFFAENSNNYSSYEEVLNGLTDNLILHYQAGVVETVALSLRDG